MRFKWLFGVISLVMLDQGIKGMLVNPEIRVINSGAALGLGGAWGQLWQLIVIIILLAVIVKFKFNWQTGLITAGGLANLIDRVRWGGVVDYLGISLLPRFNLADCLILAGLIGLLYSLFNGAKNNL
ncbi:signal peptidase II [Microgenomates group bacterium]|nr:signal peptidase II [Microgenomates group bacterium]